MERAQNIRGNREPLAIEITRRELVALTIALADVRQGGAVGGESGALAFALGDRLAAPATLHITIPGGFTAAKRTRALFQAVDAATAAVGVARVNASGTTIDLQASVAGAGWTTTAADNTSIRLQMSFEVA